MAVETAKRDRNLSRARDRPLGEVDALRGIAITLVVAFHINFVVMFTAALRNRGASVTNAEVSMLAAYVFAGHTGVTLFFVISGFLLSRPFLIEAAGGDRVDRRTYFRRRGLRIMPLYFVAVSIASIACARHAGDVLRGLPYLVFLNSFEGASTPLWPHSDVWWSLATEAQFYLLLPCLPFIVRTPGRGVGLAGIYIVAYSLAVIGVISLPTPQGLVKLWSSLFGRGPLFACGIGLAWLYDRHGAALRAWGKQSRLLRAGGADVILLGAVCGLGLWLKSSVPLGQFRLVLARPAWHLIEGGLWTIVMGLLLLAPLRSRPFFVNRWTEGIGLISYSIYLVHYPLIWWFHRVANGVSPGALIGWTTRAVLCLPIFIALLLGVSALTYFSIERPFLRRKARLTHAAP